MSQPKDGGMYGRSQLNAIIQMSREHGYPFPTSFGEQNYESHDNRDQEHQYPSMHDDTGNARHFTPPELYRAATTGDVDLFRQCLEDPEPSNLMESRSPQGDTVLHTAAQFGHDELVQEILRRHDLSQLIQTPNLFQNTPLHVAASSGHLSTVQILVWKEQEISLQARGSSSVPTSNGVTGNEQLATNAVKSLLRKGNIENNTALHLALINRWKAVACFLFEQDPEVSTHSFNSEMKSPMLIVAESTGYEALLRHMITRQPILESELGDGVTLYKTWIVLAAIGARNKGILDVVLRDWPEVFSTNHSREIMHPLFLAAFMGDLEGVSNILSKFRETAYFSNKEGFYPIHLASTKGHVEIIKEFLKHCPDSRELRNDQGQTILHLAAQNCEAKLVRYILRNRKLQILGNEKDRKGNTALHLATEAGHAGVVYIMTWCKQVNLEILNNKEMTALDVADTHQSSQLLTWLALKEVRRERHRLSKITSSRKILTPEDKENKKYYKDSVNTLMLVSTLIVTITFAAGLTSPGGDNSKPNPFVLHVFMVTDSIAMYSSMTAVVGLIWAHLSDINLFFILMLLACALGMVFVAFMAGAYLVASNISTWLACSVLVVALIFFSVLVLGLIFFSIVVLGFICFVTHNLPYFVPIRFLNLPHYRFRLLR